MKLGIFENPWRADTWSLTGQGFVVRRFGMAKAREMEALAKGVADNPAQTKKPPVYIFNKHTTNIVGGDGGGSSGNGPPS